MSTQLSSDREKGKIFDIGVSENVHEIITQMNEKLYIPLLVYPFGWQPARQTAGGFSKLK